MKRFVNFRCFLVMTLFIVPSIIGAALGVLLSGWFYSLSFAAFLAAAWLTVHAFLRKKRRLGLTVSVTIACMLICTVSVVAQGSGRKSELKEGVVYELRGRVESVVHNGQESAAVLKQVTADGKAFAGGVRLSIRPTDHVKLTHMRPGDFISVKASVYFKPLLRNDNIDGAGFVGDIRYGGDADEGAIDLSFGTPSPVEFLRFSMQETLNNFISPYGELAYSMITGSKGGLDHEIRGYYNVSGLSHLLAVSGLHIGVLLAAVGFLLERLRVGRIAKLVILCALMAFYCVLADFAPGVVRASIMCLFGLVGRLLGRRRDPLNTLCFAAALMLTVQPFYLFHIGFLMSMSAVLGLVLFSRFFIRLFRRLEPKSADRLPRPVRWLFGKLLLPGIAASLSAQLGVTPITLYYFHSFPSYAVLANVLVLPLVQIAFVAVFVTMLLAMLVPAAGIVLSYAGAGLALIDTIAAWISRLPLADIRLFGGITLLSILALYFLMSRFVMFGRKKWVYTVVCALLAVLVVGLNNISPAADKTVLAASGYGDVTSLVIDAGQCYVVGDCRSAPVIGSAMTAAKKRKITAVYVNNLTEDAAETLIRVARDYPIGAVYCPALADYPGLYLLARADIPFYLTYPDTDTGGGIALYANQTFCAFYYKNGKTGILFLGYGVPAADIPDPLINACGVIRAYNFTDTSYQKRLYLTNYPPDDRTDKQPDGLASAQGRVLALDTQT
ncbi:MAG: ComEC/Rec2 family competence protein, partial [Clostridiales bacterium]|nr:ComEC/Rec2 family competence protein [Clostridiales bacterium]